MSRVRCADTIGALHPHESIGALGIFATLFFMLTSALCVTLAGNMRVTCVWKLVEVEGDENVEHLVYSGFFNRWMLGEDPVHCAGR